MPRKVFFLALLLLFLTVVDRWMESVDYSVTISYVNVWVKATDKKGASIPDLAQQDLTILEDGKPVQSECFEYVQYDGKDQYEDGDDPFAEFRSPNPAVPDSAHNSADASKKFVLFLDLLNTTQGEMRFIQPKLQDFLTHTVDDANDVMLAALLPNRKLGVLVPFTRNHESVADVLWKANGNQTRDWRIAQNETELMDVIRDWQQGNRNFASPLDFYRQLYGMIHVLAKEEKEQGMFTLKALRKFGDYLSSADLGDHTVIVYVSGGFTTEPGREYYALVDEAMKVYLADPKSQEPDQVIENPEQDIDVINEIRDTAWYLNRLNVTLYSIDTRGFVSGVQDISQGNPLKLTGGRDFFATRSHQEALSALANETGGMAFIGQQNFKATLSNMIEDLSHQYLLCYRAPDHKKRGDFHSIKVVSKRPNVKLRYRKGYLG
jgi:VWFA-related protein